MGHTLFAGVDLSTVSGLETVRHIDPSSIGIDTIYLSKGRLPEVFLRGAGVPEPLIANMKALVAAMEPIQFFSCFISYSSTDQEFAERLYADQPANIFVTKRGHAKILDFGLAKLASAAEVIDVPDIRVATDKELLTNPGTLIGTMAYMSPEQARGEELDPRSDLFSFGAVLYEMTSGRMAFLGNTAAIIYEAILNRAPIPLSRLKPELPPKLEEIVNMALEKDRKLRYQNAADIRTDLLRLKHDKGLTTASAR